MLYSGLLCNISQISNCIMRGIYDDSGVFFTPVPVTYVLYNMLILIHQQHVLIDNVVLCVLLQIFLLNHITYTSFFFIIPFFPMIVSNTFYFIITYVSLGSVSLLGLCHSPFLVLVSPLSLLCIPLHHGLISIAFVLVLVLLLGLSLTFFFTCALVLNLFCNIFYYCLIFMTSSLVYLLLLGLSYGSLLVLGLYAAPQLTLWYFL